LAAEIRTKQTWQWIPTKLTEAQFEQFILPHLSAARRGPVSKLPFHQILNSILQLLYTGCQSKELSIQNDQAGPSEIHDTRIYGAFRHWKADGCMDAIFTGSVAKRHQNDLLDTSIIHGDGTTTAEKKWAETTLGLAVARRSKATRWWPFATGTAT
jgi:hypothetical protein